MEVKNLKERLESAQGYLKAFEEIIDKGELQKFREYMERQYDIEAQEIEAQENSELTKEHPITKKAKAEVK